MPSMSVVQPILEPTPLWFPTNIWGSSPLPQRRNLYTTRRFASRGRVLRSLRARERGEPAIPVLRLISPLSARNISLGTGRADHLGIDLDKRGIEVRKLFYAAFARGLVKDGYDPEEALQEVYKGLLARNLGKCPFDVTKSSFGHYVHIVTRCVLANYIRKEKRRSFHESTESQLGPISYDSDGFSIQDAPDLRKGIRIEPGSLEALSHSISVSTGSNPISVQEALHMLAAGHPRRKVCSTLKIEPRWLDSILATARTHLLD